MDRATVIHLMARLLSSTPLIVAYIAAWEWIGVLGVVGVFLIAGVVTSHIVTPAVWRFLARAGRDPRAIYLRELDRLQRRAEA